MNFIAYEGQGFMHLWCMTPAQTSSLRYSEGSGLNSSDPVLRSDWRCQFQGLIRTLSELTPAASLPAASLCSESYNPNPKPVYISRAGPQKTQKQTIGQGYRI